MNAAGAAARPSAMVSRYFSFPAATCPRQRRQAFRPEIQMIGDDESLHLEAGHQEHAGIQDGAFRHLIPASML